MWNYEKRLEYPINITRANPEMARLIISQFGGPDCGKIENAVNFQPPRSADHDNGSQCSRTADEKRFGTGMSAAACFFGPRIWRMSAGRGLRVRVRQDRGGPVPADLGLFE